MVTLFEGDVLRPFDLERAVCDHEVDSIIHLAANPMLTVGAHRDPFAAIELNIIGTTHVLEVSRVHGLKRVVVASSNVLNHHIEGGGDLGDTTREEAFPRPISIYSSCKQAVENLGLNYAQSFGVDFVALRYSAVADPGVAPGGADRATPSSTSCGRPWPARKRWSQRRRWSGSIQRTRPMGRSLLFAHRHSKTGYSTSRWVA